MSDSKQDKSGPVTGGCLCGKIRYEADRADYRAACCHCRMCQQITGAPFISFIHVAHSSLKITSGEPKHYQTTDISDALFCGDCGTTLMIKYYPEYYDATVVLSPTLDDPNEFPPDKHSGVEGQLHWLKLDDGFPRTRHVDDFIEKWKAGVDFRDLLIPVD